MDTFTVHVVTQIASIVVLFALLVYTKMQKSSNMQKYASMLIISTILMLAGYTMEMLGTNLESSYYGNVVSYIGSPFLLLSVFMFLCTFYDKQIPQWAFAVMMGVGLFISAAVFTNKYHYLYYKTTAFDSSQTYSPLILERGPLYIVNIVAIVFYLLAIFFVMISSLRKSKSKIKLRLSVYVILMVLCSVAGFILYFIDVADGYDTTMFGLNAGTIFLALLFFRCRIFDVVDMAKDYALEISSEGLMVFDDTGKVIYENKTASTVVGDTIPKEFVVRVSDGKTIYREKNNVYSVNANSIRHKNNYLGKSVEIYDISDSYNYSTQLEKAIGQATERIEGIQRLIVASFASLVEARSLETGDHIKRVGIYVEVIAEALKHNKKYSGILSDNYISTIVSSSALHDVGKISISDTILLKPGRLTAQEFEEMKKHSELGSKIIKSLMGGLESESYVNMASEIALYHHERWDGTGYPSGLKGNQIPLSARIVAVADCYDAMTSQRCYKEAFSDEKAIEIIREESGTHFDPEIVEAFILNRKKIYNSGM